MYAFCYFNFFYCIPSKLSSGKTFVEVALYLLLQLKKLKVSAFSSCQVKVTLDGLFSSMYLDSSRKKMCSLFWP